MGAFEGKKISVVSLWTGKMHESMDFYSRIL